MCRKRFDKNSVGTTKTTNTFFLIKIFIHASFGKKKQEKKKKKKTANAEFEKL
jgi:hypothetical protein